MNVWEKLPYWKVPEIGLAGSDPQVVGLIGILGVLMMVTAWVVWQLGRRLWKEE